MSKISIRSSSKTMTRFHGGGRGSAGGGGDDSFVIRLPGTLLLLLVARSVLVAVALVSLPWLLPAVLSYSCAAEPTSPAAAIRSSRWINSPFCLPMLLRDLQREGFFIPGSRAVFLGDARSRLPFLRQHKIASVSSDRDPMFPDCSVDFVLSADGFGDASFVFADRVLKLGGVAVAQLSTDPSYFYLPPNYKMVYIRRFGSTIVAIKKIANSLASSTRRRLLTTSEEKKEALNGLEDVLLEPPFEIKKHQKLQRRTKFLPDLIKDSLSDYPRRVFVEVGSPGKQRSKKWFERNYPRKDSEFEIIRLDVVEQGRKAAKAHGISDWLRKNVMAEDYVVMKAEAEVVEEMVEGKAIGLVDELFLECRNQWQKGKRSRRAYWECLALYGKLKDEGVAVHQWWG